MPRVGFGVGLAFGSGLALRLGNCNCNWLTRTRLLGRQERVGERSRGGVREAGPPRRGEGWAPHEEGGYRYWRAVEAGVRRFIQYAH